MAPGLHRLVRTGQAVDVPRVQRYSRRFPARVRGVSGADQSADLRVIKDGVDGRNGRGERSRAKSQERQCLPDHFDGRMLAQYTVTADDRCIVHEGDGANQPVVQLRNGIKPPVLDWRLPA